MPEAFRIEICAGFDHRLAARILVNESLIEPDDHQVPYRRISAGDWSIPLLCFYYQTMGVIALELNNFTKVSKKPLVRLSHLSRNLQTLAIQGFWSIVLWDKCKLNLYRLSHHAISQEKGTSGTNSQNQLVPLENQDNPNHINGSQPMGQKGQAGQGKNNKLVFYSALSAELAMLIEAVGQQYQADEEEIEDLKKHVLNFCNTQDNGLEISLNGFQELKAASELTKQCNQLKKCNDNK